MWEPITDYGERDWQPHSVPGLPYAATDVAARVVIGRVADMVADAVVVAAGGGCYDDDCS